MEFIKTRSQININLIVLIITLPILCIISAPLTVLVVYLLIIIYALKNNIRTFEFFLCFTILQNMLMILCANKFNNQYTTLFCLSKEIMLYICVAIGIIQRLYSGNSRVPKRELSVLVSMVVIALSLILSFISSSAGFYSKIVAIRTIMLPFICFLFGLFLNVNREQIIRVIKFLGIIGIMVSVIGIIDLFIFKDRLWILFPLEKFFINKGTYDKFSFTGLPTNFTTWDYVAITGGVSYRLISIFADPLLTGHFLFGVTVLLDAVNFKNKRFIQAFTLIGAILTLSKGVYISILIWVGLKILSHISYKSAKKIIVLGLTFIGIFVVSITYIVPKYFANTSIATSSMMSHLNGLISGFTQAGILGNDLGLAGSVVYMLEKGKAGYSNINVVESWVGAYVYQMGYIGFIALIFFWKKEIMRLLKGLWINRDKFMLSASTLLIAVLVESFLSESSISIVGTGFYFIIVGIICRKDMLTYSNSMSQIELWGKNKNVNS